MRIIKSFPFFSAMAWSLEEIVLHHVCLLDAAYVSLYIWLCEMGLLSLLLPFFQELSAHGKTRTRLSATTASSLERLARDDAFLVEKSNFKHFYIWGLVSLACCIALGSYSATLDQGCLPSTSSLVLLAVHFVRRAYECFYVHQWRKGSKIHVLGYILGSGHYIWLPMIFIKLPCRSFRCNLLQRWDEGHTMGPLAFLYGLLHHVPIWFFFVDPKCERETFRDEDVRSSPESVWRIPVFGMCLLAQYEQYRHHVLLANLRKSRDSESKNLYSVPAGGWFDYISCPHYLAEVFIYVCFTLLLELEPRERLPLGNRHWLMLGFVTFNLGISAMRSHEWYRTVIPDYDKLDRKAIIPFIF
jgi:3-oxo-5-alpha-steroid 4-dehydrogenase 3 / polyprenol reductase